MPDLRQFQNLGSLILRGRDVSEADVEQLLQMNAELEFSGRLEGLADEARAPAASGATSTGVLPVHIRVPTGGQVYRFARTIIQPSDPLSFSVVYTRLWVISPFLDRVGKIP